MEHGFGTTVLSQAHRLVKSYTEKALYHATDGEMIFRKRCWQILVDRTKVVFSHYRGQRGVTECGAAPMLLANAKPAAMRSAVRDHFQVLIPDIAGFVSETGNDGYSEE
jgi:hypothetical protein